MSQKLLAEEKAKRGMFLSLRELSHVTGIANNKMCRISKESGFPLFEGRVRFVDFEIWYRKKIGFSVDASPLEESTFAMENVPHYVRTYLEGQLFLLGEFDMSDRAYDLYKQARNRIRALAPQRLIGMAIDALHKVTDEGVSAMARYQPWNVLLLIKWVGSSMNQCVHS